ncbi:acyl-CoA dehydrogenase family protein [Bradyrhizobium sp. STM 3557]|uniref:acyl-CoA dehydrogenase family protein n=1 Tax=Bradyrhizobium sp. STM 3557 TaxID=578920 RepID=UPI00388DBCB9
MATSNIQIAHVDQAPSQPHPADDAGRLITALRELAPNIAARSKEIEDGRRVPGDIALSLRKLGLFRSLLPRSLGGLELTAPDVVQMLEILAAADSSVGWIAMIGVTSQIFCTRAPLAVLERVYRNDPDALIVGVGTPVGQAEKIDGGYRVSGRWPFSSGCQNAQWIGGHCVVCKDGQPVMTEHGPQTKLFLLPADRWRIEETWQAVGLTGTGSHHVVLDNIEVPEAEAFNLFGGKSAVAGPLESDVMPFNASFHAAVAVGIASGAMADLVAMANSGRRQLFAATELKDSAVFQHEVGKLNAELRAARALTRMQVESQWSRAVAGTVDSNTDLAEGLQGSAWVNAACTNVVSGCYALGGSSAIMNSSPLQRRLRDIHTARQHGFAQERFYGSAGRNVLGFTPVHPISGQ